MNIAGIKAIVNSSHPEEVKEQQIIAILAHEKNVIPTILKILERERSEQKELLNDMNLELSRAHSFIEIIPEAKTAKNQTLDKAFVVDNIAGFYYKYRDRVSHCFNRFNFKS